MKRPQSLGFEKYSGFYLGALFILVFSVWQPELFPTTSTLYSVTADRSISAIMALALLVPLICGVYDLSVGATVNLSTITAVLLINQGYSLPVAIAVSVLLGTITGALNGYIVVKLKVNSFITTLGMASVITAVQVIFTDNQQPLPPINATWTGLTQTTVLGFQVVVFYLVAVALVLWWVLSHTPAGRYLYAVGSSPDAARLSGVRVDRWTWLSLVGSGTIAGFAGVLYASLSGPSLSYGSSLLLPAFAAVFLGSTQITPGRFNVWGTVLAIYVLAIGVKGLQLVTDVQWLDGMFSGVALITAVAVAVGRQRSGDERKRKRLAESDNPPSAPPDRTLDAAPPATSPSAAANARS